MSFSFERIPSTDYKKHLMTLDWHAVFVPSIGVANVMLRGTLMYLALFTILRFIGRRQAGHFGPADLLVIVLTADAAQNGSARTTSR